MSGATLSQLLLCSAGNKLNSRLLVWCQLGCNGLDRKLFKRNLISIWIMDIENYQLEEGLVNRARTEMNRNRCLWVVESLSVTLLSMRKCRGKPENNELGAR